MGLINGLWLTVLGILGASNLIIARKPDAKEMIAKLAPYQGWIGAISALWGVWGIIWSVMNMGLMKWSVILWVTILAASVVEFALGLLLGVGVLKTFIKNPQAQEKMDQMNARMAPKQGVLGIIAIGVGIWCVIAPFMFRPTL